MKDSNSVKLSTIISRFKKPGNKIKVTIVGAFGARNVGDLAIMKSIVNDLSNDDQIEYCFASRDDVLRNFYRIKTVNPFSASGLLKLLSDDAIVIGAGGLYGHETHRYLVWMLPFLSILKILFRKKLIFYNVGVYDAESKYVLRMLWSVLRRADEISFRDDSDFEVIPGDIRSRARVEPDITFQLRPREPQDPTLINIVQEFEQVVGLSLRYTNVKDMNNSHDARIAHAVKDAILELISKKNIRVLFIPFQPIDSEYVKQFFDDVLSKCPDKFIIVDTDKLMVDEIKWIISRLHLAIGMRLHFQIFANDLGIPLIGISYAPKCTNFLKNAGQSVIDAYNINSDEMKNAITHFTSLFGNAIVQQRKEL